MLIFADLHDDIIQTDMYSTFRHHFYTCTDMIGRLWCFGGSTIPCLTLKTILCAVQIRTVPINAGAAVAQWLRCCATNRKTAGSIPASVSGFFIDIKSFRSHYGPGIDSASNRNEYQEHFLGVKVAGA